MPQQDPEITDIAIAPKRIDVPIERVAVNNDVIKSTVVEPVLVHTVAAKAVEETDQSSTYILNAPIKKTPLRGFFRKVSRVVEKVANPEEGKKGVRIANLEIALN